MPETTRIFAYASGLLILAGGISLAGSVRTEWAHPLILIDDLSRSPLGPELAPNVLSITVLAVALVLAAVWLRTIAKPIWSVLPVLAAGVLTSLLLISAARAIQHRTYVLLWAPGAYHPKWRYFAVGPELWLALGLLSLGLLSLLLVVGRTLRAGGQSRVRHILPHRA